MASTIFHIALLLWSGLFIMAGAMLMIASQIGHLAEAVEASTRATTRPNTLRPQSNATQIAANHDDDLVISLPLIAAEKLPAETRRAL